MAETKAPNVSEIKKLEAELAQRRDAAKTTILAQIGEHISSLKELGFFYSLSETPKMGRPRKGGEDGLA